LRSKPQSIDAWLAALDAPTADRDYKPGHERVAALLSRLPLRRPALRIRIAGTNGKGSTAHMLAAALKAAGLKTGLFTSPHIHHFNERIAIDGMPVDDATLLALLERVVPAALEIGASYFETATALALLHFSESGVDAEVLEAGVGARLDATTAIEADMALITPIGLDHLAWLGDTLASVTREKAHVADGCATVLSAAQEDEVAALLECHAPGIRFIAPDRSLKPVMAGAHQQQNGALALAAIDTLCAQGRLAIATDAARLAIEKAVAPGRLQHVKWGHCDIWLDAAHNRHAIEALLPSLPGLADPFDAICVFTREDRSLDDCVELLRPHTRAIVGAAHGVDRSYANAAEALAAESTRHPQAKLLLLGSFTTVDAALSWLKANPAP
jgi:dihydrofolate synthase/folylpolyglutamate synthase